MDKPTSNDMTPKKIHDKDLELDKKIEALRRKNAALMKRYKEVEEDRKKAEEEGMALQCRKGKADDLSITISKAASDSRVVITKPLSPEPEPAGEGPSQGAGREQRTQLTVTMSAKKGKRVVSEKSPGPADSKRDEVQPRPVESARAKQPTPETETDTTAQVEVKQTKERNEEHQQLSEEVQGLLGGTDLNIPTSKEEQEEYLRWKKEREQIDRERVARHKNAKGQWRRAWDMDKSEAMFTGKSGDWTPSGRGGRNSRRSQNRTGSESHGHVRRGKTKETKNVQAMGSKAKGKDRLTGRARRWELSKDESFQDPEQTTLEEFLEELDALTESSAVDQARQGEDTKSKDPLSTALDVMEDNITQEKANSSAPQGSEKKVRFSDELTPESRISQELAASESKSPQSMKDSSPWKKKPQGLKALVDGCMKEEGESSPAPVTERQENDRTVNSVGSSQPVEVGKCSMNSTNTEELIDSGLSVLNLESGEPRQAHSTSSDKAREHGKIV